VFTADDARQRLAELCGADSGGGGGGGGGSGGSGGGGVGGGVRGVGESAGSSMVAEMVAGLVELTVGMESAEDAAELLQAHTGCDRGVAHRIAAALRLQGLGNGQDDGDHGHRQGNSHSLGQGRVVQVDSIKIHVESAHGFSA